MNADRPRVGDGAERCAAPRAERADGTLKTAPGWLGAVLHTSLVVLLAATASLASAQEPEGFPDPGEPLVDQEFGVRTRQFGLDRRVEMYQWQRSDDGYERVWRPAPIVSAGFAPGHDNPTEMPLENRRWWASRPSLDGKPLDADVLRALGEWRVLHPNFTRLPANLAASFQPEGEGLGSAENPLDPQIGDLRITWRELELPSLAGRVELRDGTWRLVDEIGEYDDAVAEPAAPETGRTQRLWPWFGVGLLVIVGLGVASRRKRLRR